MTTLFTSRLGTCLLGTLFLTLVTACQAEDEEQREADLAALRQFVATAGAAVNSGDVEAEVDRFTADGIYMWPDAPSIRGQESMRDWFARRFAQVDVHLENEMSNIESYVIHVCFCRH